MDLLSGKVEKVKAVGSQDRVDADAEEEKNYVNNQGDFQGNVQGNQNQNYYDKPGYKDREQGHWKNNNNRCGFMSHLEIVRLLQQVLKRCLRRT